jgi:hypothetical protein
MKRKKNVNLLRWFLKTPDGDVIDGPFKTFLEAVKEKKLHEKTYKYKPVLVKETINTHLKFAQPGEWP